ncbi:MAG: adenylosuccinate synthetase [Candidatus Paceibacterota bacterium]
MPVKAIVGLQWGDEGKGKLADIMGDWADYAVRCQGGANAGHSVWRDGKEYHFHQIPSAILNPKAVCIIGNGAVVDLLALYKEVEDLQTKGIDVLSRLYVSKAAHLVLPKHIDMEADAENKFIGTTGRGIGPCYRDKIGRHGLRCADFCHDKNFDFLPEKLRADFGHAFETFRQRSIFRDTVRILHQAWQEGKNILLEGAQGAMLDIDHGTYPFVTSSNTTTPGLLAGCGLPRADEVHGVFKAFSTRVGSGPFLTELEANNPNRKALQGEFGQAGAEFGTTTGRQRRIGWLDLVALKRAILIDGVTHLHMTKADCLSAVSPKVQACYWYQYAASSIIGGGPNIYPIAKDEFDTPFVAPLYHDFPPWPDVSRCKDSGDLPLELWSYIQYINKNLDQQINTIGVGPDRESTITLIK